MDINKCPDCGKTYKIGEFNFCPNCGARLSVVSEDEEVDTAPSAPQEEVDEEAEYRRQYEAARNANAGTGRATRTIREEDPEDKDVDVDDNAAAKEEQPKINPVFARRDMEEKNKNKKEDADNKSGVSDAAKGFAGNIMSGVSSMLPKRKQPEPLRPKRNEFIETEEDNNEEENFDYEEEAEGFDEDYDEEYEDDENVEEYDANHDGYYNDVIAEIDARTEHVSSEMVFKTIAFITVVAVVVIIMLNIV